jgi:predicted HTH transcriptional regulator
MATPSPRDAFDDPSRHWTFLTQASDDNFEGQHFERKKTGQAGIDMAMLKNQLRDVRDEITQTISAFANRNVEGGLLVLGLASDGTVSGIDHLSEEQKNSLTDFETFLHYQAAEARFYQCMDGSGSAKTICLIFVPYTTHDKWHL